MEFAGHERLDTDRHYQHVVETERRRIISGMENDAKDAIPSVSGNDASVPRNAGGTSVEIARLLERTDVAARITLLKVMDTNEREDVSGTGRGRNRADRRYRPRLSGSQNVMKEDRTGWV